MIRFIPSARVDISIAKILVIGLGLLMSGCIPDFLKSDPDWVVINAGAHDPTPMNSSRGLDKPSELSATVTFDSTCIYDLKGVDQDDWNKVIGLGFVSAKGLTVGVAPHQIDGARVGWRWNLKSQRIDLGAYVYVDGKLTSFKIAEVAINQPTKLTIKIDYERKLYQVMGGQPIPFTHDKTYAYTTGLYFGGNQVAPHKIRVKIVD
ncbi:MAG: hypothetical protein H7Z72_24415 [Bacteroidetes bacterium]|nr:hypothetical protein [Fibrella sp.]